MVGSFLDRLDETFTAAGIPIVHLKLFDSSASGWLKAAACSNCERPRVEGNLDALPANRHQLLVNLRAVGDPAEVRRIFEMQLQQLEGKKVDVRLDCFRPSPPKPEQRIPRLSL
jgi:hypothetical protein